ncbi:MAG: hypothetical protein EXR98_23875 [Gemmataceae bacterium]|nr:hypothetical protein [Gemmataceae bacterium]
MREFPLIGQEVSAASKEKRPKFSPAFVHGAQEIAVEKAGEELLRQILGNVRLSAELTTNARMVKKLGRARKQAENGLSAC